MSHSLVCLCDIIKRGVVWEEVIIMLPDHVTLILLSATVPNTKEFAEWVGRTKKKKIYVISTNKRPVPLEHFLYAEKELYKLVDSEKKYSQLGWKQAYDALNKKNEPVSKGKQAEQAAKRGKPAPKQASRSFGTSRSTNFSSVKFCSFVSH